MIETLTPDNILALSWKAPYAQLMLRDKTETRTWETKYRGWVLICCSQTPYSGNKIIEIAGEKQFSRMVTMYPSILNYYCQQGMAIAIGKLVNCRPMTPTDENACFVQFKGPRTEKKTLVTGLVKEEEKRLWCHIYKDVVPIEPFLFKGGQKWSRLTQEQIALIKPLK